MSNTPKTDAEVADWIERAPDASELRSLISHAEAFEIAIAALTAECERLREDAERLMFIEQHVDAADCSGYGSDDKWWTVLHHDGNRSEGETLRVAIDAARKDSAK